MDTHNGRLGANKAKEGSEHAKHSEKGSSEANSDLGHLLDGLQDVKAAQVYFCQPAPLESSLKERGTHG
jgi:ferredoxin-NADP reductase